MEINDKAINSMIKSITKYINEYIKSLNFDVTRQGIITKILSDNKYLVTISGAVYTVPCYTEQKFKLNESVLVLCVQNDFQRMYIMGKGS